jgi:hypothetical protein
MKRALRGGAVVLMLSASPAIAQLEHISAVDAASAVRTALQKASDAAVAALGKPDGFLGNARVRIPLPDSAQRAENIVRRFGGGKYADELIVSMNRAAEAAVPEARALFLEAVKKMTLQDAKGIVSGGPTAATDYFRRSTQAQLHARFLPIVQRSTARVDLAQKYDEFAGRAASVGLMKSDDANLDEYVTRKALDGLFLMVGEEEKQIRQDPLGSGSSIIRRVFGALH